MQNITRDSLSALGELHTAGVVLRNRGESHKFKRAERDKWRAEYDDWKGKVVDILKEADPAQAQRIQTLNRIPDAPRFLWALVFVGKKHRKDLQTLEERLERLEQIMYKDLK